MVIVDSTSAAKDSDNSNPETDRVLQGAYIGVFPMSGFS